MAYHRSKLYFDAAAAWGCCSSSAHTAHFSAQHGPVRRPVYSAVAPNAPGDSDASSQRRADRAPSAAASRAATSASTAV